MATPPRAASRPGVNTPSGRFWIGKSACPLAEATQLRRATEWVSSIMIFAELEKSRPLGAAYGRSRFGWRRLCRIFLPVA